MKSLHVTALGAPALSLVLSLIAAAQEPQPPVAPAQTGRVAPSLRYPGEPMRAPGDPNQLPRGARPVASPPPSQSPPLPVAEAKNRYQASHERLQNLVKGGNLPSARWKKEGLLEARLVIEVDEQPRDRLRKAVADDFDARRQLQQAELAELEKRVARIKRALEIHDAMRDTFIDQRTDELLDKMEEDGKSGKHEEAAAPDGVRLGDPVAEQGAATPPADSDLRALKEEARILKLRHAEAKADFERAERACLRASKLFQQGAISQRVLDEEVQKQNTAKVVLDRVVLQWAAFLEAHASELRETKEPSAGDGAVNAPKRASSDQAAVAGPPIDDDATIATPEHDVDQALANLASAERAYERAEKLRASGAIEQALLDEQAQELQLARIQRERAEVKLAPADDEAAAAEKSRRLAALDVQEAEANRAEQKIRYERFKRHLADNAIQPSLLDEQAEEYKHAQIQLERAEAKLKALGQPPAGDRAVDEQTKTSSDQGPTGRSLIAWGPKDTDGIPASAGEPIASIQIGQIIEPKKAAYAPGDVLTARLFFKYTGKQPGTFKAPRSEVLEKLGIELVLRDAAGDKLNWQWGPAHKEVARSGHDLAALEPGEMYPFPKMKLVVGRPEISDRAKDDPTAFAYLDVRPGQTARLSFKLAGDGLNLQSGPFEFRVAEPAKPAPTRGGPVTDKAPD